MVEVHQAMEEALFTTILADVFGFSNSSDQLYFIISYSDWMEEADPEYRTSFSQCQQNLSGGHTVKRVPLQPLPYSKYNLNTLFGSEEEIICKLVLTVPPPPLLRIISTFSSEYGRAPAVQLIYSMKYVVEAIARFLVTGSHSSVGVAFMDSQMGTNGFDDLFLFPSSVCHVDNKMGFLKIIRSCGFDESLC